MSDLLRIYLFGGLSVERGGLDTSRFRTRKTAGLFAYLAYRMPRAVAREILIDLFWPDDSPERGRTSLNTAISSLRRQIGAFETLPEPFLVADRNLVRLNERVVWTDVAAFRRLAKEALRGSGAAREEALGLYKGDLLAGFYDDWIISEALDLSMLADAVRSSRVTSDSAKPASPSVEKPLTDNLPEVAGPLVGREVELDALSQAVASSRLVTLTGAGGLGKTRLAIELGACRREAGNHVWMVHFAGAPSGIGLADEVLRQLKVPRDGTSDPARQLATWLERSPCTLILDNLEHLEGSDAELPAILSNLHTTKVVATSRRRLNLEAESVFELGPLAVPSSDIDLSSAGHNASIRLFAIRAATSAPGFNVNSTNIRALSALCRRLEGISLAIEIAASRAQVFNIQEMVDEMDRPLEFLVSRIKDRSERHRSIRGAIDWSFRLLRSEARSLLPKLAVAKGGWTLASVKRVLSPAKPESVLQELVDASLLTSLVTSNGVRFQMHSIIREFGLELMGSDELHSIQLKRIELLSEQAMRDRRGRDGYKAWVSINEADVENIRDCLEWASVNGEDGRAAKLVIAVALFWHDAGYLREGLRWAQFAESCGGLTPVEHAEAHLAAGLLAIPLGELEEALRSSRRAEQILAEHEIPVKRAAAVRRIGAIRHFAGDLIEAERLYEESLELSRRAGDDRVVPTLLCLANVLLDRNAFDASIKMYGEAATLAEKQEDARAIEISQGHLARALMRLGRYVEAERLLIEAVDLGEDLGHPLFVAVNFSSLADISYRREEFDVAAMRYQRVLTDAQRLGDVRLEAHMLCKLAKVDILLGQPADAELRLLRAASAFQRVRDPRMASQASMLLADVTYQRDRAGAALHLAAAFEDLKEDVGSQEFYDALLVVSDVAESLGLWQESVNLVRTVEAFFEATGGGPDPLMRRRLDKPRSGSGAVLDPGDAMLAAKTVIAALCPKSATPANNDELSSPLGRSRPSPP